MKILKIITILTIASLGFFACDDDTSDPKGRIELSITDAPIYDEDIVGVHIKVLGVEIRDGDGTWLEMNEFDEPVSINLLDYQNGEVYFLTEDELNAGDYDEIRLILDMPEMGGGPKANPGTYLEYEDGSVQPLFVPSGATSGYKAKGEFSVPAGGVTSVTIDFNVRKSVVKAGNSGKYILKPVLRLVENDNVGLINGEVIPLEEQAEMVVYAYDDGIFTEDEIFDPENDDVDFPNAVTSGRVRADGTFTLAFMEPGIYDLYAVAYDENGEFVAILVEWQDVELAAGEIEEVILEEIEEENEG